jgi:AraC family transcriptional regulator
MESTYAAGLRLPRHSHAQTTFCLVLRGQFVQTRGPDELECRRSTVLVCPPDECHADRFSTAGARCFILETSTRWAALVQEHSPGAGAPAFFQGGEPAWLMTRLHREFRRMDSLSPLVVEGLALELAGEAIRAPAGDLQTSDPCWLGRVRELLHARFREPLSLHVLAREAGVHPAHLARVFRRSCDRTVGDYIRWLRVEAACRQLETTSAPLIEIALANGFAHQAHFCTAFRRITGQTPGQYRKETRAR